MYSQWKVEYIYSSLHWYMYKEMYYSTLKYHSNALEMTVCIQIFLVISAEAYIAVSINIVKLEFLIRIKMNFSTGCDDAVREAITQSGINNGASTHICVRKTDQDEEI